MENGLEIHKENLKIISYTVQCILYLGKGGRTPFTGDFLKKMQQKIFNVLMHFDYCSLR